MRPWSAAGYVGPPPVTVMRALESWTLDLPALCAVAVLAALYLAGARRIRRGGQPWPVARTVAFCAGGLGSVAVATMSSVGVYTPVLFYARSLQTILLLLVAPLFVVLGRPLTLAAAASPAARRWIEAAIGSRAARILTFPALTALVLVVTPFLLYFTPVYAAGLHSTLAGEVTRLVLVLPGLVFFWTLVRVDPVPKSYPYVVSLWVSGVEVIGDAILGLAVLADPNLIAGPYYRALARPWGPSLHVDQVLGGGALWILGDIVGLPFFAAQLIHMMREDDQEAARVDAELDAAEAGAVVPAGGADSGGEVPSVPQPWWESDPRFTGRFRR